MICQPIEVINKLSASSPISTGAEQISISGETCKLSEKMTFLTLALAGASFIFIGSYQALLHHNPNPKFQSPKFHITISLISFSFLLNSIISLFDSISLNDRIGTVLHLQTLAVAALFLLFAALGILTKIVPFPSSLTNLVLVFAFLEEFLLFYMQKKDVIGIENRYFDLMLFPIFICLFATLMELKVDELSNVSCYARLARGVGLILQGTWLLQMGISFYTSMLVHGCKLNEKSRGNYTIRCSGHEEYHRGRAIATLQFNCHLAFMVVVVVVLFSILNGKERGRGYGGEGIRSNDGLSYRPIGGEMLPLEHPVKFTLDSDDNEDVYSDSGEGNIVMEKSVDTGVKELEAHL